MSIKQNHFLKSTASQFKRGDVATTADQAEEIANNLGGNAWLVKAQVHAGGRGKAGGVKFVKSSSEVSTVAKELLGKKLITHQSGPDGQPINSVLVASAADIKEELYLGAVVDRASKQITFMASASGGMNIEEVAEKSQKKLLQLEFLQQLAFNNSTVGKLDSD